MNAGSPSRGSPPARRAIQLLLINAHPLYRQGLRQVLELEEPFVVVGEAGSVAAALALAAQLHPDVVLMDRTLPDGSGIAAVPELRRLSPGSGVLVLATFPEDDEALQARQAGAHAYLAKTGPAQELIDVVRLAAGVVPEIAASTAPLAPPARDDAAERGAVRDPGATPAITGTPDLGDLVTAGLLYITLSASSAGFGGLHVTLQMGLLGAWYLLLAFLFAVSGYWILRGDRRGYTWGLWTAIYASPLPVVQQLTRPTVLLLLLPLYLGAALLLHSHRCRFGAPPRARTPVPIAS